MVGDVCKKRRNNLKQNKCRNIGKQTVTKTYKLVQNQNTFTLLQQKRAKDSLMLLKVCIQKVLKIKNKKL